MVLEELDFLSPPITLYYRGSSSHTSCISGILSILSLILVIIFSIHEIISLFKRESQTPTSTSFTYFKEDVGIMPLNSSNLFHFISFEDYNNKGTEDFNFSLFNVVGLEDPISTYENNNNLNNYNHWLYGYCNNQSDIKGIEDMVTNKFLTNSACIRKYYDKETGQYYDTNHPNFKWPSINHGTFHPDNTIYSIIIKSCEESFSEILFGDEFTCKDIDNTNIPEMLVHFNFVDEYIDILKYNDPVVKYFYRIENKFDKKHYSVNHLNFNPAKIKSNIGYIFEENKVVDSFFFDRNDVFTYNRIYDIFMGYSLYLNNRITYYERTYKTISEVLTVIGGNLNIFILVMSVVNNFVNSFMVLKDFNCLLNLFSINSEDIDYIIENNILNKKFKVVEEIKRKCCSEKNPTSIEKIIKEEQEKDAGKETVTDQTLITEKEENSREPKITSSSTKTIDKEEKELDLNKPANKNVFRFGAYFIYKITFGKKCYENLENYEKLRKEIISVENLMHSYLMNNNLLKIGKRRSKLSSENK